MQLTQLKKQWKIVEIFNKTGSDVLKTLKTIKIYRWIEIYLIFVYGARWNKWSMECRWCLWMSSCGSHRTAYIGHWVRLFYWRLAVHHLRQCTNTRPFGDAPNVPTSGKCLDTIPLKPTTNKPMNKITIKQCLCVYTVSFH